MWPGNGGQYLLPAYLAHGRGHGVPVQAALGLPGMGLTTQPTARAWQKSEGKILHGPSMQVAREMQGQSWTQAASYP